MNVTRLQQPPLQTGSARSALEAEEITPDVRSFTSWKPFVCYSQTPFIQFLSIRLVNKRTRAKLSPEPLDLTPIPNKGQLFVVASVLGWFVAIIRSNTGLGMSVHSVETLTLLNARSIKLLFPRHLRTSDPTCPRWTQTLTMTMSFNRSGRSPSPLSTQITSFSRSTTLDSLLASHMAQSSCSRLPPSVHRGITKSPHYTPSYQPRQSPQPSGKCMQIRAIFL